MQNTPTTPGSGVGTPIHTPTPHNKSQNPPATPGSVVGRPQREALKSSGADRQPRTPQFVVSPNSGNVEPEQHAPAAIAQPKTPNILQPKSPSGAARQSASSREAYRESLLQTRQMLEGNVPSPSSATAARRPTSRPASSRQIDSAEVFPLPRSPTNSKGTGLGAVSLFSPTDTLGSPTNEGAVVSEASSASSPECVIKVFGGFEPDTTNPKPATPSAPARSSTTERRTAAHSAAARPVSSERKPTAVTASSGAQVDTAQRRARSVSRDARPNALSTVTGHAIADAHPTSTHAWQPRLEASAVSMNRVHRAQRVYLGDAARAAGNTDGSGAKGAYSNVALGFGAGAPRSDSSRSRRVVSAVPRTDIEIPWLEREATWRRRQRQQEREHSAHPQSRGGDGTSQRGGGPVKPSRLERSGVRSATSTNSSARTDTSSALLGCAHDTDGRAVFMGAANVAGGEADGDEGPEGHPWSWMRDYPKLQRPPSRQRHPTQSLHLSEPFPGGGGWLNMSEDNAGVTAADKNSAPFRSGSSFGGRDSKQRPVTQETHSPTGTSFGDKMELRPGTSVVGAVANDWAAPRYPAPQYARHDSTDSRDSDASSSSSPRSVSSVASHDSTSCIPSPAQEAPTPAMHASAETMGLELESLSDTSTPSVSPTHPTYLPATHPQSGKTPLGGAGCGVSPPPPPLPPDLAAGAAHAVSEYGPREEYCRPSSSRESSREAGAVKVYRPSSRKARPAVGADDTPSVFSSASTSSIIAPVPSPSSASARTLGANGARLPTKRKDDLSAQPSRSSASNVDGAGTSFRANSTNSHEFSTHIRPSSSCAVPSHFTRKSMSDADGPSASSTSRTMGLAASAWELEGNSSVTNGPWNVAVEESQRSHLRGGRDLMASHHAAAHVLEQYDTQQRQAPQAPVAARVVQSAKIIRQSRPETARGGSVRGQRVPSPTSERSRSTISKHSSSSLSTSPVTRPPSGWHAGNEVTRTPTGKSTTALHPPSPISISIFGEPPDTPVTLSPKKRTVVKTSLADKRGPQGSDSEERVGSSSLDRRAAGLGETAPDHNFDFEAIGGCPWAGSPSSSDTSRYLIDDDLSSDWSDGKEEEDARPDTAPAANGAHYSSTMLADTASGIGGGGGTNRTAPNPPPPHHRVRPDSAAAGLSEMSLVASQRVDATGRDVELDPLKKRDPWINSAGALNPSLRSEGRGAWARPTSAQSAYRPRTAGREQSLPLTPTK